MAKTWQTIITEDGLDAVKKLLKKFASKNSAISCHWMRGRSRIDILWIVGKVSKFNQIGIVPVNYTNKDILIKYNDETQMLYANTNKQQLEDHLFAVGYLTYLIIKKLYPDREDLAIAGYVSGVWHDIGKIDPHFQKWIAKNMHQDSSETDEPEDGYHIDGSKFKNFSFEKYPRHNEISILLFDQLFKSVQLNTFLLQYSRHAIYWHHAKPIRDKKSKTDFEKLSVISEKINQGNPICFQEPFTEIKNVFDIINKKAEDYGLDNDNFRINLETKRDINWDNTALPNYKNYNNSEITSMKNNVRANALQNILRSVLISADRKVSSLDCDDLSSRIANKEFDQLIDDVLNVEKSALCDAIHSCLDRFKSHGDADRNSAQNKVAADLARKMLEDSEGVLVLRGPAGCGKTKIALEWALKTDAKRMIWICPRVEVCFSLYNDLSDDSYLPDVEIEICTGELHEKRRGNEALKNNPERFSGDIIITTIDQVVSSITTHRHICAFIDFLNSHVVFDEFHELITIPGLNLLFAELVEAKKEMHGNGKTLLISATPNPFFLERFLDISIEHIYVMPTFNKAKYNVEFEIYDHNAADPPFLNETFSRNTFVISNTATNAQIGFIRQQDNENCILIHSKFTNHDKRAVFNEVYRAFGADGTREFDLLRSGPIVQAALNITCDSMVTEITSPENWLQRLGRLNRFGDTSKISVYKTYVTKGVADKKQNDPAAKFLNTLCMFCISSAWYSFLKKKLANNACVTLEELYSIYDQFYSDAEYHEAAMQDLNKILGVSKSKMEEKLHDPMFCGKRKASKAPDDFKKLKQSSLRDDTRFMQMACVEVANGDINHLERYMYDPEEPEDVKNSIILPLRDTDSLIDEMHKKHHQIMQQKGGKYEKRHKVFLIKNEAKDSRLPIFLSYTRQDLKSCNSEHHNESIYYVSSRNRVVGAMSITNIDKAIQTGL